MKVNDIRNMSAAEMEQKVSGLKDCLLYTSDAADD